MNAPPKVALLINLYDEFTALTTKPDTTVEDLRRMQDLSDDWDLELADGLGAYSKPTVEGALIAAGRRDMVDKDVIGDALEHDA